MKRYGLIGHPLGHSFSKAYFTEKFEREGLDCEYQNYDLGNLSQLSDLLRQQPDLRGFNVTIPYKEAILPYLDLLDPVAAEVGAVNTVKVMADGRLKGYNTDVIGILSSLRGLWPKQSNLNCQSNFASGWIASSAALPRNDGWSNTLILGTGGASKAVQYVLRKQGLPYHLVSRSAGRGDLTYQDLTPEIVQTHLLIINATPVGMAPHIDEAPLIPYEAIKPGHTLFDLIYNPEETVFLRHGREHGAQTINGLTMLHTQAEASWGIWNHNEN